MTNKSTKEIENVDTLQAWENAVNARLQQASEDIAAGRTYSIAEARRMVAEKRERGYAAMAADQEREAEAQEWCNALVGNS